MPHGFIQLTSPGDKPVDVLATAIIKIRPSAEVAKYTRVVLVTGEEENVKESRETILEMIEQVKNA